MPSIIHKFLPDCDLILVFKNGKLVEQGTYKDLKQRNVNFSAFVNDYVHIEDDPAGVLEKGIQKFFSCMLLANNNF